MDGRRMAKAEDRQVFLRQRGRRKKYCSGFEEEMKTLANHRFEPTAMSPQFPGHLQRLAVAHPGRWAANRILTKVESNETRLSESDRLQTL